jgi:hypothetical protein
MDEYIQTQESTKLTVDDEIRIRSIAGTTLDALFHEEHTNDEVLFKVESDTETSDEEFDDPMAHLTAYWYPNCGKISILLPMFATQIAELTGSSLFAEEAEKRYRIFQGDFQLALEKIQRLEPLLVCASTLIFLLYDKLTLISFHRKLLTPYLVALPFVRPAISWSGLPTRKHQEYNTSG